MQSGTRRWAIPVAGEGCLTANADYPAALCAATRFGHILGALDHSSQVMPSTLLIGKDTGMEGAWIASKIIANIKYLVVFPPIFYTTVCLGTSQCCGLVFRNGQGGSAVARRIQRTTPFVMARMGTRPGKGSLSLCMCKGLSLRVRKPFLTYLHCEATQTYRKHIYFSNRNIITAPCN